MESIGVFIIAGFLFVFFGFCGCAIAKDKGRETAGGLLGLFLGPVGCIIAALLPDKKTRICLHCKNQNSFNTKFCSSCGASLADKPMVECPYCQKRFPV
jgi:hypothetical protein